MDETPTAEGRELIALSDGERRCIQQAASLLAPSFAGPEEDSPEAVLDRAPRAPAVISGLLHLLEAVFPGQAAGAHLGESKAFTREDDLRRYLERKLSRAWSLLRPEVERAIPYRWIGRAAVSAGVPEASPVDESAEAEAIMRAFFAELPEVRKILIKDVIAAYNGDPAALTYAEIKIAYPGLQAIASHRIAHELQLRKVPIVPRIMSEWTHTRTGVDIHPGARIGEGFFIDHATGVVIGETARIGKNVKIYQGVTLGAKSFTVDEHGHPVKSVQRHPTVEDGVVIYANSTILGGDTVIGAGSIIGGNVFLMESVPPGSVVVPQGLQPKIKLRG